MKQFSEHISKYDLIDLINQTDDKLSFVDRDYVYRAINQSYVKTFNRPTEEMIDRPVWEIMGKETFESVVKPHLDRALAGETVRYEAWFDFPGSERSYLIVRYHPVSDEAGRVHGVVVTATDITERKRLEEEKTLYEKRMLDQSRMAQLGEMITFIAHQWRGPLNTLSSYLLRLRMNREPRGETAELEILDRCESLIEQLSLSIEELYMFYRQDGHISTVSLKKIVDHLLALLQHRLDTHRIAVWVDFDDACEAYTYRSEFLQALIVFIENAIESLSRSGQHHRQITLRFQCTDAAVSIEIIDNGNGVDAPLRQTLFEAGVTTKESEGHGYGLYFARKIITSQMGGEVELIPDPEGGHFRILLPRE